MSISGGRRAVPHHPLPTTPKTNAGEVDWIVTLRWSLAQDTIRGSKNARRNSPAPAMRRRPSSSLSRVSHVSLAALLLAI